MDFGWAELLVIGVVALIVIGPKDLPEMFRTLGRFTAKARGMARDFSRAMEQAAKETGVDEVASDLKKVTSPKAMGLDAMKGAADRFEKWDPLKNAAKPASPSPVRPLTPPPMPPSPPPAAPAAPVAAAAAAPEPVIMGPATAALAEQQAQRKAIAAEAAEKLRAVGKPAATAKPAAPAAKTSKAAAAPAPAPAAAAKPARKKAPSKTAAKPGEE
jgi:sec-independent protein translocase protein TatB